MSIGFALGLVFGCSSGADDDPTNSDVGGGTSTGGLSSVTSGGVGGNGSGGTRSSEGGATESLLGGSGGASTTVTTVLLPKENGNFDYQIGAAYPPPSGVEVISRDRNSAPSPSVYNVCYVNGFQVQPDEETFFLTEHPELLLRDDAGNPVIDEDWQEMLLDTSTEAKRSAIAAVVGSWITGCKVSGFDAVEIDNLDSYSRSGGRLEEADNVSQMALFSALAHSAGLAIAQKNSSELLDRATSMGTDFAVVEECNRYDECDAYRSVYGNRVFVIEYRVEDFRLGCANFPELGIVLRDRNVTAPGSASYVFDGC
ncbi:MAG: endo alpha-1,4 polygalactosaminidase [Polyangiaceae bacterium]